MRPVLCLVSDRRRMGGDAGLVDLVRRAAIAGVHLIQVREKDLEARALCDLVARCVEAVNGTCARVLVNDRFDVAVACGAHGVHLPGTGVPAPSIRPYAPPGFIIGRSVHARDEAVAAAAAGGLDYMIFGSVFGTDRAGAGFNGPKPAAGVDALGAAASAVSIPVLAIGGVTLERIPDVARAGAAGLAAIALFADAAGHAPERLQTLVKEASLAFDTRSVDT